MMIKQVRYVLAMLVAAAIPGQASAVCVASGSYVQLAAVNIKNLLAPASGSSIACVGTSGNYTNQEVLQNSLTGNITDYKKGPSDPIDPSKVIGTYTITSGPPGQIAYSYAGGPIEVYEVYGTVPVTSGSYDFCTGGSLTATVNVFIGSAGPCP
jgi:hypothetical protein